MTLVVEGESARGATFRFSEQQHSLFREQQRSHRLGIDGVGGGGIPQANVVFEAPEIIGAGGIKNFNQDAHALFPSNGDM